MKSLRISFLTVITTLFLGSAVLAVTVAEIKSLRSGDLESVGFTLIKGAILMLSVSRRQTTAQCWPTPG